MSQGAHVTVLADVYRRARDAYEAAYEQKRLDMHAAAIVLADVVISEIERRP